MLHTNEPINSGADINQVNPVVLTEWNQMSEHPPSFTLHSLNAADRLVRAVLSNDPRSRSMAESLSKSLEEMKTNIDTNHEYIKAARDHYASDDLEIDDQPILSVAEEGVWVNAWVWVANTK